MKQLAKENESKPKTKYEYKTSEFLPKKKYQQMPNSPSLHISMFCIELIL